jgi:molybdenum cofactor cytidylyltransferase
MVRRGLDRASPSPFRIVDSASAARNWTSAKLYRIELPMVPGLVLAAGQSTRMGQPKALLRCGPTGPTFVSAVVSSLRQGGVADVIVVGRADDEPLKDELAAMMAPPRFAVNREPHRGQLSSLIAGLNVADRPGVHAVIVMPVDIPLVRPDTIAAVLRAAATGVPIVRATFGGRHGHPVLFARSVFDDLRRADPDIGARAVVHAYESQLVNLEVADPGVLKDVDSPSDYEQLFGSSSGDEGLSTDRMPP